jgi:hypothetical protein
LISTSPLFAGLLDDAHESTCFRVRLCVWSCPGLCSSKRPQTSAFICVTAVYATRLVIVRVRHGQSNQTGTHSVGRFLCSCFCRVCSLFTFINFQSSANTFSSDDIVCQTKSTIAVVDREKSQYSSRQGYVTLGSSRSSKGIAKRVAKMWMAGRSWSRQLWPSCSYSCGAAMPSDSIIRTRTLVQGVDGPHISRPSRILPCRLSLLALRITAIV